LTPTQTAITLYQRVRWHAQKLNLTVSASDTPHEFAQQVARLNIENLDRLIEYYVQANFTAHALTPPEQQRLIALWQSLRWQLWFAWWNEKILR
jgi:hypothetical protein